MTSKIIRDSEAGAGAEPLKVEAFSEPTPVVQSPAAERVVGDEGGVEREAYEQGFKAGELAGFAIGAQKAAVTANALTRLLSELNAFRDELCKTAETEMTALTMAIARKVIQREVETGPEAVRAAVKAALELLPAGREIVIRINPADLETVRRHRAEIMEEGIAKGVKLLGDDSIARGGAVIETNFHEADASVDGCLAEIEQRLKNG